MFIGNDRVCTVVAVSIMQHTCMHRFTHIVVSFRKATKVICAMQRNERTKKKPERINIHHVRLVSENDVLGGCCSADETHTLRLPVLSMKYVFYTPTVLPFYRIREVLCVRSGYTYLYRFLFV